jgi:hypothetical protein
VFRKQIKDNLIVTNLAFRNNEVIVKITYPEIFGPKKLILADANAEDF